MFSLRGLVYRLVGAEAAYAHCDIPCGIYDPHVAQLAAQTVLRMVQLVQGLNKPADGASKAEQDAYTNTLSRYITTKEQHADLCKRELLILWGDYFRPEHLQAHPTLHDKVFQVMKLGSRVRQNVDMQAAQDLLRAVQEVAEAFWATKNVKTARKPSNQTVGGELVVPA